MVIRETLIADFRKYAEKTFKEQITDLSNRYKSEPLKSKYLQLKAFNDQLNNLRHQLFRKVKELVVNAEKESINLGNKLEKELMLISNHFINRFYKQDF